MRSCEAGRLGRRHRPSHHRRGGCRGAAGHRSRRGRAGAAAGALAWVALGLGRALEQALAADQDNAIILDDAMRPEHAAWFEALAHRVDRRPGRLRLSAVHRRRHGHQPALAAAAVRRRRSSRRGCGQPVPRRAARREHLLRHARRCTVTRHCSRRSSGRRAHGIPGSKRFLAHLAKHAAARRAAPGLLPRLRARKEPASTGTPSTSSAAASVPSSSSPGCTPCPVGSPAVNTRARIEAAREAGVLGDERADDLRDAFELISYVRLRHQTARVRAGPAGRQLRRARRPVELRQAAPARGVRDRAGRPVGAGPPLSPAVHLVNPFRRDPRAGAAPAWAEWAQGRCATTSRRPSPASTPRWPTSGCSPSTSRPPASTRAATASSRSAGCRSTAGRVVLGGAGRVVVHDVEGVGQSVTVHGLTDDELAGGVRSRHAAARRWRRSPAGCRWPTSRGSRPSSSPPRCARRPGGAALPCVVVDTFELRAARGRGRLGSERSSGALRLVDRSGATAACRPTGPTRRHRRARPAPSSTSRSAQSSRRSARQTALTLRQVVA